MNIKKLLKNKPFCNELHFFLFAIILVYLTIFYPIFIVILLIYFIFIFKKTKLFIQIFITSLLFLLSFYLQSQHVIIPDNTIYEGDFLVEEVAESYVVIKEDFKVLIFHAQKDLIPGNVIKCKVLLQTFETSSYDGDFNSQKYYKSKKIYNMGQFVEYEVIDNMVTNNYLRCQILNFYETRLQTKTFTYLKAIFFGESDFEDEVDNAYKLLYISHILTISGMHIIFIYTILKRLLNKLLRIEGNLLTTFIIFLYVVLLDFKISALRAFLFLFIGLFNKIGDIKYTKLDIYSISFILMVFINPFLVYQNGFILTYLVSFIMIFMDEITISYQKSKYILTTTLCIFITLPIIINMNNNIAILGFIYVCIISLFLPKLLLYIMFFILVLPIDVYEYLFVGLDAILVFLSQNSLVIKFPYMSIYMIILYYFLFILYVIALVKGRIVIKYLLLLIFYLVCFKNVVYLNPFYYVTFIDVGQGDSTLIQAPNNRCNILVDSYNNIDYISSLGIERIDYVFLSHFDSDHSNTINEIIDEYKVENIFYSAYSDINKMSNMDKRWIPLKMGDEFEIEHIKIIVLSPGNVYESENDNSLVLKMLINNNSFLFTGDIGVEVEKDLINSCSDLLKSDVLKVSHHGSNTSSSTCFIEKVKPKFSIISVAKANYYGLPDEQIVKFLNNVSVLYLTKNDGNITFRIYKSKIGIKTYKR